jgi:2-oxoisovalerate dehydrogenase E1 component alpha subunit
MMYRRLAPILSCTWRTRYARTDSSTPVTCDYASIFTVEQLLDMYEAMLLARKLDERMWVLQRQGKVAFHISGMGQEACQVGAAYAMERGKDWLHPYYRDMAFVLALGMTARHLMLALFGKAEDPSSGGRQMPAHFGYKPSRIVSGSSPVATQMPQAAGIAFARLPPWTRASPRRGTNQGDFGAQWASIHSAAHHPGARTTNTPSPCP